MNEQMRVALVGFAAVVLGKVVAGAVKKFLNFSA